MTTAEIQGAIARAWCHPKNEQKIMDEDLALAAAEEIEKALQAEVCLPNLGCATTLELIAELHARAEVSDTIGDAWPSYRTVDSR